MKRPIFLKKNKKKWKPWSPPAGPKIRSHKMIKGIRKKGFMFFFAVFDNFWLFLVKCWISSSPQKALKSFR